MRDDEARNALRAAVYGGNAHEIVRQLQKQPSPEHSLQLIGDGLLLALALGVEGIDALIYRCVAELRERGWTGDDELATLLQARPDTAAASPLQPLPVDLEELAGALEGDIAYSGGRIDLVTGEVWRQAAFDEAVEKGVIGEEDEDEHADRWLWIDPQGSGDGYRDMELFIDDLEAGDVADRLGIAITGRGAFRRFKDVLARWEDHQSRWYTFSEDRQRGRARAWLADKGYAAIPPRPRVDPP